MAASTCRGYDEPPHAIGQLQPIDYLVDAVLNCTTLAESYKVAALDATNKMRQIAASPELDSKR